MKIDLDEYTVHSGNIGDYSYKAAKAWNESDQDATYKASFDKIKNPLNLPVGEYELGMDARNWVSGKLKVTKQTSVNDIFVAMARHFKGHSDTYMDHLSVDTKKKEINAEFGT